MPTYTVLIVDDDEDLAQLLGLHLGKFGYRVIYAQDGLEATDQVEKHSPDLIVLDFQMPSDNGASVHKRLQNSLDTKATPVLFISGLPEEQVRKALPERPNTRFLPKPLDPKKLESAIRELLHNKDLSSEDTVVLDLDQEEPQ